MSLSSVPSKKRKLDTENRCFNETWTTKYAFILPAAINAKPMCVICNECVSVLKEYNIRRHYEQNHQSFAKSYPIDSSVRSAKIESLKAAYTKGNRMFTNAVSQQEKCTLASLRVAWILAKKKRPFTDAETLKDCMLAVINEVITDEKTKSTVITSVQQVPLSDTTTSRRVDVLGSAVFDIICQELKRVEVMSLAVDESTDATDQAQLNLIVRYFDGGRFREELLALLPMAGHTTGSDVFEITKKFFCDNGLDMKKICLLVTDGAPSMVGKASGFVQRLKEVAPTVQSLHCIIHQSVLCAKLSGHFKNVMETIMKIINSIRSKSSLQHRLFRKVLQDMAAQHRDILMYNEVRWLSKGEVLERFLDLKEEIVAFLGSSTMKRAEDFLEMLGNHDFMLDVAFLADTFHHMNGLNNQLQGRGQCIIDLIEKVSAFQKKIQVLSADLLGKLIHFPRMRAIIEVSEDGVNVTQAMTDFLSALQGNFANRFSDFNIDKNIIKFVKNPFKWEVPDDMDPFLRCSGVVIDEGSFHMELIDLKESSAENDRFVPSDYHQFWVDIDSTTYPTLKKLSLFFLTMFGSTYACESAFSHMNAIKCNSRTSLLDSKLEHCLRIALTTYEPNFAKLTQNFKLHQFSH